MPRCARRALSPSSSMARTSSPRAAPPAPRPALAGHRDAPAARCAWDGRDGAGHRRPRRHQARLVHRDRGARVAPGVSRPVLSLFFCTPCELGCHAARYCIVAPFIAYTASCMGRELCKAEERKHCRKSLSRSATGLWRQCVASRRDHTS